MSHPNYKGDKPMTKRRFCFTLFLLICFSLPLTATAQTVNIPDEDLRAAIENKLGKAPGTAITATDMATLTELRAPNANISDLTGLEAATNLTELYLGATYVFAEERFLNSNSISDISPLAGLTKLVDLGLGSNSISDISPLAGLNSLEVLGLEKNSIANISPLAGLNNLTKLYLSANSISNLSPLANLTNLTDLELWGNSISNISPLAGLNNLEWLWLEANNISDISPLQGLTSLTELDLDSNSISDISPLAGLNNLTKLWLDANSISDISPLTGLNKMIVLFLNFNSISNISSIAGLTNLRVLSLWDNSIANISPLAGLNNLTYLDLEDNSTADISPLVANTGLGGGDRVFLRGNPLNSVSINTHIPALQRRGVDVRFDAVVAEPVDIPDPNLRAVIEAELGKAPGDTITTADMAKLIELRAPNANISDLTGLEGATNLTELDLGTEQVQQRVWRNSNSISDISAVQGLTKLEVLDLQDNSIKNISAVRGLTNLTLLNLSGNPITDISAVAGLTNLTELFLRNNLISDISPLAGLNKLTTLNLDFNGILNISPLTGLTNLEILTLTYNNISDILPLAGLNQLVLLLLTDNSISDLSPLVENRGLGSGNLVDVTENPLNSASISVHVPALKRRGVTITFDAVITEPVDIPDPNLRAAIEAELGKSSGATITTVDMETLTGFRANNANIRDLTGLEHATNLTWLNLRFNAISDISPLAELTDLTGLYINNNPISDLSLLAGLTNLESLHLGDNSISDLSPLAGLTNLTWLRLWGSSISDILPLAGLTNLTELSLSRTSISGISPLVNLTNLEYLFLSGTSISNISPVAGFTSLTSLQLIDTSISDISAVANLTNLMVLYLSGNSISDISPLAGLTNLTELDLRGNSISDLSPLSENMGLGEEDWVNVSENPLNSAAINTHIPALQSRGVTVEAEDLKPTTSEYTLTMPAGISLIHVPLRVTEVDGREQTIERISDLYDALGGTSYVNFLITYDSEAQEWRSFFVSADTGGPADAVLTDDTGVIAGLNVPMSIRLSGNPLGTDGNSSLNLSLGLNVVGLPLDDSRITRVSDLLTLEGIGGNVPVIILTDGGEFKLVGRASDPGDIEITGGQAFIMTAQRAATVNISGDAWANDSGAAAPPVTLKGIEVGDTTPVLGLRGSIVDEGTGLNNAGFRVTVKNLSTGRAVAAITTPDEAGYRSTVVDIETGRAATVGDILEIFARFPNPFIGVEPLRYTITAEDVRESLIQLPELVAYEIPAETELLSNYPNPFNPETWIPYRLAEDAFVTLTIYDLSGQIVRTIDVGHQTAAVYENRSKAVYWDGRNEVGEPVASGVYFYHLSAGDYSATRKMLILK